VSDSSGEATIELSHFTFRAPTTPGTIARTGYPWSIGISSPFILSASKTSGSNAFWVGIEAPYVSPAASESKPENWICAPLFCVTPATARTSLRRTPSHSAVPIDVPVHASPLTSYTSLSSARRFPAHIIVLTILCCGMLRSYSSVKVADGLEPSTPTVSL
jgi:hypothetical protein